jgi:hypothetical protein
MKKTRPSLQHHQGCSRPCSRALVSAAKRIVAELFVRSNFCTLPGAHGGL